MNKYEMDTINEDLMDTNIISLFDDLPFQIRLCFIIAINNPYENDHIIFNLLSNYEQIEKCLEFKYSKVVMIVLYFNRKNIHQILYETNEIIRIQFSIDSINLVNYFYLSLLISDNDDIINYTFPIDLIRNIDKIERKSINQIIIAKIIIQLINNFRETEEYDEIKHQIELSELERKNEEIIEKKYK